MKKFKTATIAAIHSGLGEMVEEVNTFVDGRFWEAVSWSDLGITTHIIFKDGRVVGGWHSIQGDIDDFDEQTVAKFNQEYGGLSLDEVHTKLVNEFVEQPDVTVLNIS